MQCSNKELQQCACVLRYVATLPPLVFWQRFMLDIDRAERMRMEALFQFGVSKHGAMLIAPFLKTAPPPSLAPPSLRYLGVLLKVSEFANCPIGCYTGTRALWCVCLSLTRAACVRACEWRHVCVCVRACEAIDLEPAQLRKFGIELFENEPLVLVGFPQCLAVQCCCVRGPHRNAHRKHAHMAARHLAACRTSVCVCLFVCDCVQRRSHRARWKWIPRR